MKARILLLLVALAFPAPGAAQAPDWKAVDAAMGDLVLTPEELGPSVRSAR